MILPPYRIDASSIPGAGKGLFLQVPMARGRVLVAPDDIRGTLRWDEVRARPDAKQAIAASVRWFEDHCTVSLDWPDECFVNHSFDPTGLWHLGFIFAGRDLVAGEEVTVDYRHLLPEGEAEVFRDAGSGREIIGFSWAESLARSSRALVALQGA